MLKLAFGRANAKLIELERKFARQVYTFSILSGHSCPYARDCRSSAVEQSNGRLKIVDGPHTLFRCFSASQEALFRNVYNSRKANMELVKLAAKSVQAATDTILANIPKKAGIIRIHVGGDFQTKPYFRAWVDAAAVRSDLVFYAYTKSLPFWVALRDENVIPSNFILTASYGGYRDDMIEKHNLRYSKVVFSKSEARKLHLPIDHDDTHAADPRKALKSFALLLHGLQPKGSEASKAVNKLNGVGSYNRKRAYAKV
jgi:hypothetical protein